LDLEAPASELPRAVPWTLALEGRARLRLEQGHARDALDDLYAVRERDAGNRGRNPSACAWRSSAALALRALGEDAAALSLAEEEPVLARAFGARRAIGVALRVSGLLRPGAEGTGRLREAVSVLRRSGARLEHARALTDLGAAIRRD